MALAPSSNLSHLTRQEGVLALLVAIAYKMLAAPHKKAAVLIIQLEVHYRAP